MTVDLDHLVAQLRRAGLRPTERQWELFREAGALALPPLLDMALDTPTVAGPEPAAFGPVHALRLVGDLGALESDTLTRMFQALPVPTPANDQAAFIWRQDLPQIIARSGSAALEVAQQVLADADSHAEQRAAAYEVLSFVTSIDPETRPVALALLRESLTTETDPYAMAFAVNALGDMGAADAYRDVLDVFKRGAVDKQYASAADLRQRMLNPGAKHRLTCAQHTLAERYDQHGPYTEEERQALAEMWRDRQAG